jgi:phenylalanyl-tRNA synthetase beta chain
LARTGEPFTTLDGKERILDNEMLMICDGEKPVAVGGVMGGLNSEIEESTTRVLLESAYFDPVSIRKTAKKLGLSTDASHRFERGVDPEGTLPAIDRAARLILETAGGTLIEGVVDERPKRVGPEPIDLSVAATAQLLGVDIDRETIGDLLRSIDFSVQPADDDRLSVRPPSFRVDVSRPQDLMEEVARLYGYNRIPVTSPLMPAEAKVPSAALQLRHRVRELLTGFGFTEAVNYSFIQPSAPDRLRLPREDRRRRQVAIVNPLTEDQSVMRTSLLPGLLGDMGWNLARQVKDLKLFEVGKLFLAGEGDDLPDEPQMVAGLWTGNRTAPTWLAREIPADFYDMKGIVEGLLEGLRIREVRFTRMAADRCFYTRPGHTARILIAGTEVGLIGEIHPETLRSFDLKASAFYFELDLDRLLNQVPAVRQSAPIPRYPAVERDTTLIIHKDIEAGAVLDAIRESGVTGADLIEAVTFLDAYEGKSIPAGSRSLSFRITYRSPEETLEDEQVNAIHKAIADYLIDTFKASLPGGR